MILLCIHSPPPFFLLYVHPKKKKKRCVSEIMRCECSLKVIQMRRISQCLNKSRSYREFAAPASDARRSSAQHQPEKISEHY